MTIYINIIGSGKNMKKVISFIFISMFLMIVIPFSVSTSNIIEKDNYIDESLTIDGIAILILYGYDFTYADEEVISGHITKGIMIGYLFSEGVPNCAILTDWDTVIPRNFFHGIVLPFIVIGVVVA